MKQRDYSPDTNVSWLSNIQKLIRICRNDAKTIIINITDPILHNILKYLQYMPY
jgi:hypothetical protein